MSRLRFPRVDRTTAFIAMGAIVLGAMYMAAATWVESRFADVVTSTSTLSRSGTGLSVWHDYLAALGTRPQLLTDFTALPATGTIVAAAPFETAPRPAEAEALASWVRSGGRLVLIGLDAIDLAEAMDPPGGDVAADATSVVSATLPGRYAAGVGTIVAGSARLHPTGPQWVTVYGDEDGAVLTARLLGRGEVVWLADVMPVSNDGIGEQDGARFAVRLALAGAHPVYFDEFHHGLSSQATAWARLGPGGQAAVWLLLAALAALLFARGRRIGPAIARPQLPEARGSAYISQLATLYRTAGARSEALAGLEDGLTRAIARRYGTKEAGLARQLLAREALAASAALRAMPRIDKDEFVTTAARLRAARNEVEGGNG